MILNSPLIRLQSYRVFIQGDLLILKSALELMNSSKNKLNSKIS